MPSVSRLDFPDKGTTNKEYGIHKGIGFHMLRSNESKMRLVRSCWIYSLGVKFKSLLCLVMQVVWLCSWKSVFWMGIKSHASGQDMKANYYYAYQEKFQCFT